MGAVLAGSASEGLLDTYDLERRPVADFTVDQTLARMEGRPAWSRAAVQLGYRYPAARSGTGVDHGDSSGDVRTQPAEDPFHPSGRPGTRAPHVVLAHDGRRISTLDLFGRGFTLLAGPDGHEWEAAARAWAEQVGTVSLTVHRVGGGSPTRDEAGRFLATYGIGPRGAVLVRPDGFVGWHSPTTDPDPLGVLGRELARLLGPVVTGCREVRQQG